MECLPASDLRHLLAVLADLAGSDADTLPARLLAALPRLIPCDSVAYNVVDPVHALTTGRVEPADGVSPALIQSFERHQAEHPVIAYYARTGDGRALRLADFLSQRELHRLGLWAEIYRPLHTEHQLAAALPARRPLVVGLVLNRERGAFTDREQALLELARPHLGALMREAELRTLLARGLEATGWEVVRLGPDGRVRVASARAERLLATYIGADPCVRRLPAALDGWLRRQQHCILGELPVAPVLVLLGTGGRLVVRFLAGGTSGTDDLLLLREESTAIAPRALAGYGLSRREAEVAAAVAEGLSNDAVARRLGIRVGTVEKHLTHAYDKLGLAGRTALAAWVRQVAPRPA